MTSNVWLKETAIAGYVNAVKAHPGVLVMVRVGDFYEAYDRLAEVLAETLKIACTSREHDGVKRPMAGVPFHSVERYMVRLAAAGLSALCVDFDGGGENVHMRITPFDLTENANLTACYSYIRETQLVKKLAD